MDASINKTRLGHLLSYDWIKILLVAVAAILVWSLVFTMTATRITTTQMYSVVNFYGSHFGSGLNNFSTYADSLFSYEVLESSLVDVQAGGDEYVSTLLETRFVTGEGDVLFVSNTNDPKSKTEKKDENGNVVTDENGETQYEYATYLQEFLHYGYYHNIVRLDDSEGNAGYFTQMKNYLANFYTFTETEKTFGEVTMTVADFDETSFDGAKAERLFRERAQKNKDKRFKKEAQIQQGVADELARIQSYCEGYERIFEYLEKGYISFTVSTIQLTEQLSYTGVYSLNLCPNEETMSGLKDYVYHLELDEAENYYTSAAQMNAVFLGLDGLDADFQYETVLLVNKLVQTVCTELK